MSISIHKLDNVHDHPQAYSVVVGDRDYVVWTNAQGDGLWVDGQQVEGESSFSLRGVKAKAEKLRRYFSKWGVSNGKQVCAICD